MMKHKQNHRVYDVEELELSDKYRLCLIDMLKVLKNCKEIAEVILFGSLAKGEYTDDSDIDLCIISDLGETKLMKTDIMYKDMVDIRIKHGYIEADILVYKSIEEIDNASNMSVESDIRDTGKILMIKE